MEIIDADKNRKRSRIEFNVDNSMQVLSHSTCKLNYVTFAFCT